MDDRRFSGRLPFLAYTGGIAWRRVQEVGVYLLAIDQALYDEEGQGDEAKRSVPCPYPALLVSPSSWFKATTKNPGSRVMIIGVGACKHDSSIQIPDHRTGLRKCFVWMYQELDPAASRNIRLGCGRPNAFSSGEYIILGLANAVETKQD